MTDLVAVPCMSHLCNLVRVDHLLWFCPVGGELVSMSFLWGTTVHPPVEELM